MDLFAEKIRQRFEKKYKEKSVDDCWLWEGATTSGGYGLFWPERRTTVTAHRYMYMLCVGDLYGNEQVHHICYNRLCVNPYHLEALSPKENTQDAYSIQRYPTCRNGHPRTTENLYVRTDGRKDCAICRKERKN